MYAKFCAFVFNVVFAILGWLVFLWVLKHLIVPIFRNVWNAL